VTAVEQLAFWSGDLAGRLHAPRRRTSKPPPAYVWPQLGLFDRPPAPVKRQIRARPQEDEENDDDPFVTRPVVHLVVSASLAPGPQTSGIRSVFDLAACVLAMPGRQPPAAQRETRKPKLPLSPQEQRHGRTEREFGVTRHVAMRHDETEEWQERERQRRARQRVPKPTKGARTRSRKLIDLIGVGEDHGA
jgi:hypothetical protein